MTDDYFPLSISWIKLLIQIQVNWINERALLKQIGKALFIWHQDIS